MEDKKWDEEGILKINSEKNRVLDEILKGLVKKGEIIFGAKLGFGVPRIDLVTVDKYRNTTGYIVKFPVKDGKISTHPYFQGFGESAFLTDQMFDESYLVVPDIELFDKTPFTSSPQPIYRLRKGSFESGIYLFDRDFNLRIFREPKGSLAKQYQRLKFELLDSILNFGEITVASGKEKEYKIWRDEILGDINALEPNRILNIENAKLIAKKILEEVNFYNVKMEISESEIEAKPRPIPVFIIRGRGLFLGDEKDFSLQLSRISGKLLTKDI
jgi:hypothetical protein